LFTTETALDALKKYDINEDALREWESELGLQVLIDEYGRKQYSPHHINLFKNVKKHLALGRSLQQIKAIISLPPSKESKPQELLDGQISKAGKHYATVPHRPTLSSGVAGEVGLVELLNKLISEKDQLHKKLVETEKLNSHLYNANNLFHRKMKEYTNQINNLKVYIAQIKEHMKENQSLKLMDDKARLQKQFLDMEKASIAKENELEAKRKEIREAKAQIRELETRLTNTLEHFDTSVFCGDWMETAQLVEIVYDNFGINIESQRSRLFRISEAPSRAFGHTAVLTTHYEYETNSLWKRIEALYLSYLNEMQLEGELIAEYVLDGVPVAKAIYRVVYTRK
jgi:DNA-binding transcriptional MerR regulator